MKFEIQNSFTVAVGGRLSQAAALLIEKTIRTMFKLGETQPVNVVPDFARDAYGCPSLQAGEVHIFGASQNYFVDLEEGTDDALIATTKSLEVKGDWAERARVVLNAIEGAPINSRVTSLQYIVKNDPTKGAKRTFSIEGLKALLKG